MTTLPTPDVSLIELPPRAARCSRPQREKSGRPARFEPRELRRVAAAVTLNISGIIAIVLLLLPIVGYNSTAQALPKAMLDGAVLSMLIGTRGRWRLVALFGVVNGMFLAFVVPAIPPLLAIYAMAGFAAMCVGHTLDRISRQLAIVLASSTFAVLAGIGIAIQVWFASRDGHEPFLWSLVAIEIAIRAIGAPLGTIVGRRCLRALTASAECRVPSAELNTASSFGIRHAALGISKRRVRMEVSPAYTLVVLVAAMVGCIAPLLVENVWLLGAIALSYAILAIAVNQAKTVISVALVMIWGWMFYGSCSFLYHHDWHRVADFGRSLALRFFPMATIALVMIRTIRPVAVVRLLRRARVSGAILLPLAIVLRAVPNTRREIIAAIGRMKVQGLWTGRLTPVMHPIRVSRSVLMPMVMRWGTMLAE